MFECFREWPSQPLIGRPPFHHYRKMFFENLIVPSRHPFYETNLLKIGRLYHRDPSLEGGLLAASRKLSDLLGT